MDGQASLQNVVNVSVESIRHLCNVGPVDASIGVSKVVADPNDLLRY